MSLSILLLIITTLILSGLLAYLIMLPHKTTMHKTFIIFISEMLIWAAASIVGAQLSDTRGYAEMICDNITYLGVAGVPPTILLLALDSTSVTKGLNKRAYLLYALPLVTQILLWTNPWHHLFFVEYSVVDAHVTVYGLYFYMHTAYSYACIVLGISMLIYTAVRASGLMSIQSMLLLLGSVIPIAVNISYTLGIGNFNVLSTPTAFSITVIFYILGLLRFGMFKVAPVALQTVVNLMSDSFIVVDANMKILDYNKAFIDQASPFGVFSRGADLYDILKRIPELPNTPEDTKHAIECVSESGESRQLEWRIPIRNEARYFTLEMTPIMRSGEGVAVILLFRDVTQHMIDMERIQNNQMVLLERERLASLGQLIGGIAHNLKTPIMSVAGGVEQIQELAEEYRASIGDAEVTADDHLEIAEEILTGTSKIKVHMSYMSDIISTVKDQAVQLRASDQSSFTLGELFKRIEILMRHELVKHSCGLDIDMQVNATLQIKGDLGSLVQVFDNIIINAIQAYGDKGGVIRMTASRDESGLRFVVRDEGGGIAPEAQERLFKEMFTTKGKHGTGLGLYMSYSTIRGVFGGQLSFTTEAGRGTEFVIAIPV